MANPEKFPPRVMGGKVGIGKLTRHLFICIGPDCCEPAQGEEDMGLSQATDEGA